MSLAFSACRQLPHHYLSSFCFLSFTHSRRSNEKTKGCDGGIPTLQM